MWVSKGGYLHFYFGGCNMTIHETSERYQIPMHILQEYENYALCGAVKKVMANWQYDKITPT